MGIWSPMGGIDPYLSRWMIFIDGENFTLCAQSLSESKGNFLREGNLYRRDVFVWMPNVRAIGNNFPNPPFRLQNEAARAYYYTSVSGDEQVNSARIGLRNIGFHPEVFKKPKGKKSKGVDIALTKDLLSHAFNNHYHAAVLIAGDGDYIPLVKEVQRLGKVLYVAFFASLGLSEELTIVADGFYDLTSDFCHQWKAD